MGRCILREHVVATGFAVAVVFIVECECEYLDIIVDVVVDAVVVTDNDNVDIVIAAAVVDDDVQVALIIDRWRAHDNDVIITENCGNIIILSFFFVFVLSQLSLAQLSSA